MSSSHSRARSLTGKTPCIRVWALQRNRARFRQEGIPSGKHSGLQPSRLRLRTEECVQADDRPRNFEDNESDLKGMEGNVSEDGRTDGIENVISSPARIHPGHLVAGVRDEDQHRAHKGRRLSPHRNFHRGLFYRESGTLLCCGDGEDVPRLPAKRRRYGRTFSRMRATAMESGPSIEQPLAHSCPPPPKPSAILATLSAPLLRRLTR